MARIFLDPDEPMNTIWCFISSVGTKDFDDPYNLARINNLEEALKLEGVLPTIRAGLHGANQRKFVAALLRFIDEDEICLVNTRNGMDWIKQGYAAIWIEYLDKMAKLDLIKYNRSTKTIRPTPQLTSMAKLTTAKFIKAA